MLPITTCTTGSSIKQRDFYKGRLRPAQHKIPRDQQKKQRISNKNSAEKRFSLLSSRIFCGIGIKFGANGLAKCAV